MITPYRKQMTKIKEKIREMGIGECRVATIEEFQGIEKRIIIVSTVRSVPEYVSHDMDHNLGFIFNPKRFNVAVSRAMSLLIVIGDSVMLSEMDTFWSRVVHWCIDHDCCHIVDNDCAVQTVAKEADNQSSDEPKASVCDPFNRRKLFGPK